MTTGDIDPIKLSDLIPSATAFQLTTCGDPACGIHLISLGRQGEPLLQTVMSPDQMVSIIDTFKKILEGRFPQ